MTMVIKFLPYGPAPQPAAATCYQAAKPESSVVRTEKLNIENGNSEISGIANHSSLD